MDYLVQQNKRRRGRRHGRPQITAEGRHVIVIGGGDTGADCIGTAHRQGALSVTNLAIGIQPPAERPEHQPWPTTPTLFEVSSAHEEGGERMFLASTVEFLANDAGEVRALRVAETEYLDGRRVPKSGTEREIPADLVLIAMGFTGPESDTLDAQLRVPFDERHTSSATPTTRRARPACSSPATRAAGSRSSSGRSPKAAPRHPPSTGTSRARPSCRSRCVPPIARSRSRPPSSLSVSSTATSRKQPATP